MKRDLLMTAKGEGHTWLIVALYAVAMAWVEAAVVYYLRSLIDRIEPYQPYPLPVAGGFGEAELIREIATLVMLFTVGWLAGATWRSRLGYSVVAFGIWDIFYYVFLRVLTGRPRSLADWDILFLVPVPWWGPVWAPVSIALLMILSGTHLTRIERSGAVIASDWKFLAAGGAGAGLALFVFMADAIRTMDKGTEALRMLLPVRFNWPLFCLALVLMALPLAEVARQEIRARRQVES